MARTRTKVEDAPQEVWDEVHADMDAYIEEWKDDYRAFIKERDGGIDRIEAAEPWSPTWRTARSIVPTMMKAERRLQTMFHARFVNQARRSMPALVAGISALPDVMFRSAQVAAAEPKQDEIDNIVNGAFDTSVDSDDLLVLRTQQQMIARQSFIATMRTIGLAEVQSQYNIVAQDSVNVLRNSTNALFSSVDQTTKERIGRTLSNGLKKGEHIDELTKRVQKTLDDGAKWRAKQIAQTETIRAYGISAENTAKRVGVEQMEWVSGQLGACVICAPLNGKHKDLDGEYPGGYNAPPAHPNCRCAQIPYFGKEFEPLTPAQAQLGIQYSMADNIDLTSLAWSNYKIGDAIAVGDYVDLGKTTWRVLKDPGENSVRVVHLVSGRTGNAKFEQIKRIATPGHIDATAAIGSPAGAASREIAANIELRGATAAQEVIAREALAGLPEGIVGRVKAVQFSEFAESSQLGMTLPGSDTLLVSRKLAGDELRQTIMHEAVHVADHTPGAIPNALKAKLNTNYEAHMARTVMPPPSTVTDIGHNLPFDINKATIVDGRSLGGAHTKYIVTDEHGERWMFKPAASKQYQATAEAAEQSFAQAFGLPAPEVYTTTINGEFGSIQRLMNVQSEGWKKGMAEKLSEEQLAQLQKHQVVDWMFSQHDSNAGAPLFLKNGDIVMVDKGQAFKFFGGDVLDPMYNPNKAFEPLMVYNDMWASVKAGNAELRWANVKPFVERVQSMDDKVFSEWLRPYIDSAQSAGTLPGGMSPANFVKMARARKNSLVADFENFYASNGADMVAGFDKHLTEALKRLPIDARPVRSYALASAEEYQAESISWYFTDPSKLKMLDRVAYDAIDATYKSGVWSPESLVQKIRKYKKVTPATKDWKSYWDVWKGAAAKNPDAVQAASYYQSSSFGLNKALRDKALIETSSLSERASQIDNLLALPSSALPVDTVLYRGVSQGLWQSWDPAVGKIIDDKAFLSTSVSKPQARKFGAVVMEVHAPQGTPAANIHTLFPNAYLAHEKEVILGRNTSLRIVSIGPKPQYGETWDIVVEIVQ